MKEDKKGRADTLRNASAPIYNSISDILERASTEQIQISKIFSFMRPGKTLLIGRPQVGKSFLLKMLAMRIAQERKEPVAILTEDMNYILDMQIKTIVEANIWKMQNQPNEYTIDPEEAEKYTHIYDRSIMKKMNITYMQFLQKYGDQYCCVFADRLSLFVNQSGNTYENVSVAINQIDNIITDMKYMKAIILTHHERKVDPMQKQQNADLIFENVNGSVAYLASTETHILVRKIHHTYDRKIYVEGKSQDRAIYIVREGKGFINTIEKWDPLQNLSAKQKEIYHAIVKNVEHGIDTDPSTIADTLGEDNVNLVRAQLSKMVAKEILIRENGFYYPSDF